MYNITSLFTSPLISPVATFGQEENWEAANRERVQFVNTLDALFLENNYQEIIEIGVHFLASEESACQIVAPLSKSQL